MNAQEPRGPWYVNVAHFKYGGRPFCSSAVDYSAVRWAVSIFEVDCAACLREMEKSVLKYGHVPYGID